MGVKFYKVNELPAMLEPDSFYYVVNGQYCEAYITNKTGYARGIGNSAMINNLIASAIAEINKPEMVIVADITARNALVLDRNTMVLVQNATADSTVNAGAALYIYNKTAASFIKVAEYENLDVTVTWGMIQGRPNATPSQIDDAVSKMHQHSNKATLDKLTEVDGILYLDGVAISATWSTSNW